MCGCGLRDGGGGASRNQELSGQVRHVVRGLKGFCRDLSCLRTFSKDCIEGESPLEHHVEFCSLRCSILPEICICKGSHLDKMQREV